MAKIDNTKKFFPDLENQRTREKVEKRLKKEDKQLKELQQGKPAKDVINTIHARANLYGERVPVPDELKTTAGESETLSDIAHYTAVYKKESSELEQRVSTVSSKPIKQAPSKGIGS